VASNGPAKLVRRDFLDEDFRAEVKRRLKARGLSQAKLARRLGMSGASLSDALSGKLVTSQFAVAIAKELEMAPPGAVADPEMACWIESFHQLSAADRKTALRVVRRFLGHPSDEL
jgi:transcriptional regulator with XRE-family HTH domain